MRRRVAGLLLFLTGCAGAGAGPESDPRVVTPLMLEPPPIYALLGYRGELGLSSAQITALDSIAERVRRQNAPLVEQLREKSSSRARERGLILVDSQATVLLDSLRANNRRAADAVGEVLAADQRATACRLFGPESRGRGASGEGRGVQARTRRRPARGAPAAADSVPGGAAGRAWTWCTATEDPPT